MISIFDTIEMSKFLPPVSISQNTKGESQFSVLPLPLSCVRVHVRVRASSGFDRGVGVRVRGRYALKPRIFSSLLETKGYPEHTDPDHPESIFILNYLF